MLAHKFLTNYVSIRNICLQTNVAHCHIQRAGSGGSFVMHVLITPSLEPRERLAINLKRSLQDLLSYGTDFTVRVHNPENHRDRPLKGIPLDDFVGLEFLRAVDQQEDWVIAEAIENNNKPGEPFFALNYIYRHKTPLGIAMEGLARSFGPPPSQEAYMNSYSIIGYLYNGGAKLTPEPSLIAPYHPLSLLFWNLPATIPSSQHKWRHNQLGRQLKELVEALVKAECYEHGSITSYDFSPVLRDIARLDECYERCNLEGKKITTPTMSQRNLIEKLQTCYPSSYLSSLFESTPVPTPYDAQQAEQLNGRSKGYQ